MLLGCRLVERRCFGAELHVDGFAGNLIGPLEVGAVTLRRISVASTLGTATFHHSLQNRSLQEVLELMQVLASLAETRIHLRNGRAR